MERKPNLMYTQCPESRERCGLQGGFGVTLFELVKLALDDLYAQACDEYGDAVDDVIVETRGLRSVRSWS
jgi:hypothetical protein